MRTRPVLSSGFTLVEIMIVVAIVGLLGTMAMPNFLKSRTLTQQNLCIENLSQIESAKQQWGVEVGKAEGDLPTDSDLFGVFLYLKKRPQCPGGGTYALSPIGTNATCTITGHTL